MDNEKLLEQKLSPLISTNPVPEGDNYQWNNHVTLTRSYKKLLGCKIFKYQKISFNFKYVALIYNTES